MCAIVDANIASEVFGAKRTEASDRFFNWLSTGAGILVAGGKLRDELNKTQYREWAKQAILSGKMKLEDQQQIEARTAKLQNEGLCKSDDQHVVALAQISGARLLYSNDGNLQQDFKNKFLIDNPRGRVYSTKKSKHYTDGHKRLLGRKGLCIMTKG